MQFKTLFPLYFGIVHAYQLVVLELLSCWLFLLVNENSRCSFTDLTAVICRTNNHSGDPFGGFGRQFPQININLEGNSFDASVARTLTMSAEDPEQSGLSTIRNSPAPGFGSLLRERTTAYNSPIWASSQLQEDTLIQALRDFIKERGGFLGEGWHVDFKQKANRSDSHIIYCAPDGKRFGSVFDVAHYLGLKSNVRDERNEKSLRPRRRRKENTGTTATNVLADNQDKSRSGYFAKRTSDMGVVEPQSSNIPSLSQAMESFTGKDLRCETQASVVSIFILSFIIVSCMFLILLAVICIR